MIINEAKKYEAILNKYQLESYCFKIFEDNVILVEDLGRKKFKVTWKLDYIPSLQLKEALDVENNPDRLVELD